MTVLHNKENPEGRLNDDFKIPLCGEKILLSEGTLWCTEYEWSGA